MPVHWVAPSHAHASPSVPASMPPARPHKAQARSQTRAVPRPHPESQAPVPALARAKAPSAPAHVRGQVAKEAVSIPPSVARQAAPSPSDVAASSAHDLDLVRRHLERFRFYPEDARRRGIGGNVDVGFQLTRGGQVAQVRIASSSGYALLDHAAEAIVARAVPFPVDRGHYRVCLRFWP